MEKIIKSMENLFVDDLQGASWRQRLRFEPRLHFGRATPRRSPRGEQAEQGMRWALIVEASSKNRFSSPYK